MLSDVALAGIHYLDWDAEALAVLEAPTLVEVIVVVVVTLHVFTLSVCAAERGDRQATSSDHGKHRQRCDGVLA